MRPIPALALERDLQPGQLDRLDLAGEGAAHPLLGLVALDRGEEADGAEVDAEDRHAGAGEAAQRVQDRAVAAEHEAEVRARLVAGDDLDARRRPRRAWRARPLCRPGASRPRGRPRRRPATASVAAGGCEWVTSAAVFTGPTSTAACDRRVEVVDAAGRRRRTRGRSRGCPSGPGRPEEATPRTGRPSSTRGVGDGEDRLAAVGDVADDAAADPLAAELELRLDHRQRLAARAPGRRPRRAGSWSGR